MGQQGENGQGQSWEYKEPPPERPRHPRTQIVPWSPQRYSQTAHLESLGYSRTQAPSRQPSPRGPQPSFSPQPQGPPQPPRYEQPRQPQYAPQPQYQSPRQPQDYRPQYPPPAPRRKRRVFLWVFLAIQAVFIIWIVAGLASHRPASQPPSRPRSSAPTEDGRGCSSRRPTATSITPSRSTTPAMSARALAWPSSSSSGWLSTSSSASGTASTGWPAGASPEPPATAQAPSSSASSGPFPPRGTGPSCPPRGRLGPGRWTTNRAGTCAMRESPRRVEISARSRTMHSLPEVRPSASPVVTSGVSTACFKSPQRGEM